MRGVDRLCAALSARGTEIVFGLPGTQNIALFDALKQSKLASFTSTSEMNAAFVANGYARVSGRPAVLAVIPGPGFTYALTGIAEARLDSVPLVCLIQEPAAHPDRAFQLQQIDQKSIVSTLVKGYLRLESGSDFQGVVAEAFETALSGEPGPVVIELARSVSDETGSREEQGTRPTSGKSVPDPDQKTVSEIARAIDQARRPLMLLGQGAMGLGDQLSRLRERIGAIVLSSTSGRGILSEAEEFVLNSDLRSSETINELVATSDLILGLGIKLSHNGCCGFELELPADRFIHVDRNPDVLGANYAARLALAADLGPALAALLQEIPDTERVSGWQDDELRQWQRKLDEEDLISGVEPVVPEMDHAPVQYFFELLRAGLPVGSHLVCDSGMHQMLARRHYKVYEPAGLLVPTDFQSMGYGIPAALGAKLAHPEQAVAALIGDGGLAINGLELLGAVRDRISLPVFVFVDGHFGLIRHQQIENFGRSTQVKLPALDIAALAASMGAGYFLADQDLEASISSALRARTPTLIEVRLTETTQMRRHRARRATAEAARRALGPRHAARLKGFIRKLTGRGSP